ncbi:MAG: Glycerol kinase [Candidatus Heimdallarchaeota archaeon LC_3]|nr:MAG: Glycerol kinase [Candidatus Heimdallarchaeota archaeon LC_3]
MKYTLVVDTGTTGTRSSVYNEIGNITGSNYLEHNQFFPNPGFVEHNPLEIFQNTVKTMKKALEQSKINFNDISAVGITNQRETVVIWDKNGNPLAPAIVWQDTRTINICKSLELLIDNKEINKITGLLINTYFSGVKLKWFNENLINLKGKKIYWGTIDSWLIWKLTKNSNHVIDCTNASRTLLMDIKTLEWSQELINILGIPKNFNFPEIKPSICLEQPFGYVNKKILGFNKDVPINIVLGDQQAALFGQACYEPGELKNTYGTGCFTLINTGELKYSSNKLLSTVAYQISGKNPIYALEGATPIAGAAIQWLKDGLGIIKTLEESELLANQVDNSGGVIVVPAFTGLFSPYWDPSARGTIFGIERSTKKEHIIRATLEGIAWSTEELILSIKNDIGLNIAIENIKVDGGACKNSLLLQMQADYSQVRIDRPSNIESTSLGAHLALKVSLDEVRSEKELKHLWKSEKSFYPKINIEERNKQFNKWKIAISRCRNWIS